MIYTDLNVYTHEFSYVRWYIYIYMQYGCADNYTVVTYLVSLYLVSRSVSSFSVILSLKLAIHFTYTKYVSHRWRAYF